MKSLTDMQLIAERWATYLADCWVMPMTAPACHSLWVWIAKASMIAGVLFLLWAAWKVLDYHLKYRAAMRAEAAREQVADDAVMQKHVWVGDDTVALQEPDADFAAKIRDEIDRRKLVERGLIAS